MQFYSSRRYETNIWNNLTLLGRGCLSWKPQWTRLAATGSFVQRSPKPLPWVHSCPPSPPCMQYCVVSNCSYLSTVRTPTHVAMCDRALGGFPWLLISVLAPESLTFCGAINHATSSLQRSLARNQILIVAHICCSQDSFFLNDCSLSFLEAVQRNICEIGSHAVSSDGSPQTA